MKKISIITPCFNAEKYIAETILSVITQRAVLNHSVELEYIICDGQSTDRTVDIAQSLLKTAPSTCTCKVISEADTGMYDALSKGLQMTSGDINAYINAGDLYHPAAFGVVSEIFTAKLAEWITGYTVCYNGRSQVIEATLPYRYRRHLFECGYYGNGLPHVQQESTFWAAHLNQNIDYAKLASFRYVGDFYLWLQFARAEELKVVKSHLGGFKYHGGHLSQETIENVNAYQLELQSIVRPPNMLEKHQARADRVLWSAPYKLKKRLAGSAFLSYDRSLEVWTT
ncbi:MAG: glycosyltransferase [Phormidesmis sp.]